MNTKTEQIIEETKEEDARVQEVVNTTLDIIVDRVMDNYGLIDERAAEYVELTEGELRRILLDTVDAVAEAVHDQLGMEH